MDMCSGPILPKLVRFTLPILIMNMLQLLYNAADVIVVGQFVKVDADLCVGAIGSTGALVNLILQIFIGLGVGVNVVTGQMIGAGRKKEIHEIVKTAVIVSLISGVVMGMVGIHFSDVFLNWMGTPKDVEEYAVKYLKIYFVGVPASLLYNFLAGILRADGDTKRPLLFLTISGLTNVLLNMVFVIFFGMNVDGVAIATVISQYLSAVLVVITLLREKGYLRLDFKNFKIYGDKFKLIVKIGVPSGIYGSLFSVANVIIQSAVNSFDNSVIVAGISAANGVEGFIWMAMSSIATATTSFVSQNMGAGKLSRIKRTFFVSQGSMFVVWAVITGTFYLAKDILFSFYLPNNPQAIQYGFIKFNCIALFYFLGGMMDVMTGVLRGMGYSLSTTVISLIGTCATRVLWIFFVFTPAKAIMSIEKSLYLLHIIYPISWIITFAGLFVCFLMAMRKYKKQMNTEKE